ncbi:MAG TPA: ABC transporter permease, partial [Phycicoccus elongatus]|nr:ABC transporter permease [Phycicoccus elongatus]
MSGADEPIRLAVADVARIGGHGLRSRPTRVLLSALGIAIGVAAMMAVLGISASSKAEVGRRLDRLGTNLLRVTPGRDATGEAASLPASAPRMISRIGPVTAVSAVGAVPVGVYRSDHVPSGRTSSVIVLAADTSVLATLGGSMSVGHWLSGPSQAFPTVVLGAAAADRLDTHELGTRLWLGRTWATVVGILQPLDLASELDQAALVGWDAARDYLGFDGSPSTVYLRATESQIGAVTDVLARTANPRSPGEVSVSRPSDALAARAATDSTLTALLLGLGGVALLVGGIGVA